MLHQNIGTKSNFTIGKLKTKQRMRDKIVTVVDDNRASILEQHAIKAMDVKTLQQGINQQQSTGCCNCNLKKQFRKIKSNYCCEIPPQCQISRKSNITVENNDINKTEHSSRELQRQQHSCNHIKSNNNNTVHTNYGFAYLNFTLNVSGKGHCHSTMQPPSSEMLQVSDNSRLHQQTTFTQMLHRPLKQCLLTKSEKNTKTEHLSEKHAQSHYPKRVIINSKCTISTVGQSCESMHSILTFIRWLLFFTVISCSGAVSIQHGSRVERQVSAEDGSQRNDYMPVEFNGVYYLQNFGFLPLSDRETGAYTSKEELIRSVETFQKFAGLKVTGKFDEATVAKMTAERCGVRDVIEDEDHHSDHNSHRHGHRVRRYTLGPTDSVWTQKIVTYRILNYTPDIQQQEVSESIQRAFMVWSQVTLLDFREVYHGHADILIKFARHYHSDGYPFDGPGLILAHAFFPGPDRGGDMHFDEDETWAYRSYEGTDLFSVAAHEIGHSLGLAHSSVTGSLMYPWYQGYTPNFQLHSDDIAGIQYLYGVRRPRYHPSQPDDVDPPRDDHPNDPRPPNDRPTEPPYFPEVIPPVKPVTPRPEFPPTVPHNPGVEPDGDMPPNPCTTNVDAVSVFRSETFVFKGKWFWRLSEEGLMSGYPVEINRFWYGLPDNHPGFDAAYERPNDGKMVFFKDDRYWVFSGNDLDYDMPPEGKPITDLGFPPELKKVDAAFVWGYNGKTYFISNDMYWKYYEFNGQMAHDYPRDMSVWKDVPTPVDGAFADTDGVTYFFHGKHYYEFHDTRMKLRKRKMLIASDWLGCKNPPVGRDGVDNETPVLSGGQTGGVNTGVRGQESWFITQLIGLTIVYTVIDWFVKWL